MYLCENDGMYVAQKQDRGITSIRSDAKRYTLAEVRNHLLQGFDYGNFVNEKTNKIIYPREYIVFRLNEEFGKIVFLKHDIPGFFETKKDPYFTPKSYTLFNFFLAEKLAKEHDAFTVSEAVYKMVRECK